MDVTHMLLCSCAFRLVASACRELVSTSNSPTGLDNGPLEYMSASSPDVMYMQQQGVRRLFDCKYTVG